MPVTRVGSLFCLSWVSLFLVSIVSYAANTTHTNCDQLRLNIRQRFMGRFQADINKYANAATSILIVEKKPAFCAGARSAVGADGENLNRTSMRNFMDFSQAILSEEGTTLFRGTYRNLIGDGPKNLNANTRPSSANAYVNLQQETSDGNFANMFITWPGIIGVGVRIQNLETLDSLKADKLLPRGVAVTSLDDIAIYVQRYACEQPERFAVVVSPKTTEVGPATMSLFEYVNDRLPLTCRVIGSAISTFDPASFNDPNWQAPRNIDTPDIKISNGSAPKSK